MRSYTSRDPVIGFFTLRERIIYSESRSEVLARNAVSDCEYE
ncbi:hypothetical protein FHEFKHOI_01979 [Candidatus Methanoperedenaceae archaeon GB50]|nr:MAG: hypothetical protein KBONHNOK_00037 [Candidatus Methanoperedenaceae archaeon GB50]CAD7776668.1 hypothetical protein FHEFKHOI_01979 [Candidatus Methanoperedenaceae archaeon GB50]